MMNAPGWWWADPSKRRGPWLWPIWPILLAAEACYRLCIWARNARYDKKLAGDELFVPPVPTISVGNITVGGAGKTPFCIWLAELLAERRLRPAILARGYGAGPSGLNDEILLAARKCPSAVVLANPDRIAAAREALSVHAAEVLILDDAFQHRRIGRHLDIVLIDATRGLGNGHLLPAGPLREPCASLARASMALLTRAEQVAPARLEDLAERVRGFAGRDLPVGRLRFEPAGLYDLHGNPAEPAEGPVGVFAGIGNFSAFVKTCRGINLQVAAELALPDHVRYDHRICQRICRWAEANRLVGLVTTEKDAVKLCRFERDWPVPIRVVPIRTVPEAETRQMLCEAINALLSGQRGA